MDNKMIQSEPVNQEFASKTAASIVRSIPRIKGYSFIGSLLFQLLPVNSSVTLKVLDKAFYLDLKYRSQLAAVKRGAHEPAETAFIMRVLQAGDVFFDLGANWGYYSAVGSTLVGPQGVVVAVEANRSPFLQMLRLLERSSIVNVMPFNIALSDQAGQRVSIYLPWYRNDTGGYIRNHSSGSGVVTKTLDLLWKQLGSPSVKMVKLDTEGHEPLIIKGGLEFFSKGVTDFALVEVSEWTYNRVGIPYHYIYEQLCQNGFEYVYDLKSKDNLTPVNVNLVEKQLLPKGNILFSKKILRFAE